MADIQIGSLPRVDSATGTDFAHIMRGGVNYKIRVEDLVPIVGATSDNRVFRFKASYDYVWGVTDTLELNFTPSSKNALYIFFDGLRQETLQYEVSGTQVIFNDPIPEGVFCIEINTPTLVLEEQVAAGNIEIGGEFYTWPDADGADGDILVTDGDKNLSWRSIENLVRSGFERQPGNIQDIGGGLVDTPSIAQMGENRVVLSDNSTDSVRIYDWDGLSWTQTGNSLPLGTVSFPVVESVNRWEYVLADITNKELQRYLFDGLNHTPIGKPYLLNLAGRPIMRKLSENLLVVYQQGGGDSLTVLEYVYDQWVEVASTPLSLAGPSMVCLSGEFIVIKPNGSPSFEVYVFDGSALTFSFAFSGLSGIASSDTLDYSYPVNATDYLHVGLAEVQKLSLLRLKPESQEIILLDQISLQDNATGDTRSAVSTVNSDGDIVLVYTGLLQFDTVNYTYPKNVKTISGSDSGNTAVNSLATGLEQLGLVFDETTSP